MEKAKKQYPTDDEIARVMAERKLNRIGAVQYLRRQSAKATARVTPKVVEEHKAKAEAGPKGERKAKYDKAMIVKMFESGKTVNEIAQSGVEGLKGISPVYTHRVLFGSENSGGVSTAQAARRKERARRAATTGKEAAK